MNLIILENDDINGSIVNIAGKKLEHILTFIKPIIGDKLKVGVLNGFIGYGTVTEISEKKITLSIDLQNPPPAPLPLKLIIAMPRPKVLNRLIENAASMGIKEIFIIKTWRVEKSYWNSPMLGDINLKKQMITGLEQSKDTILPTIKVKKLFKPFVEDELKYIIEGSLPLVAHPMGKNDAPRGVNEPVTLAIGPEGGFIPYEIDALERIGFKSISLGERILRVETALPYLIGRIF
ncbi:MAG: 16S rRNA (uracil(1498)-N(3))-methyltransferase [Leptospirales bacterium]|nr:16S rRNA (uracil(1498)-N(3))-methyltransferase [Leptospirales bacterium]